MSFANIIDFPRDRSFAFGVDEGNFQTDIRLPVEAWPAHDTIFASGGGADCQPGPRTFDGANLRDFPPTHSTTCVENADPLSAA